jgi:hypothetical protein
MEKRRAVGCHGVYSSLRVKVGGSCTFQVLQLQTSDRRNAVKIGRGTGHPWLGRSPVVNCSRVLRSVPSESKQSRIHARSSPQQEASNRRTIGLILACACWGLPRGARRSRPLIYAAAQWPRLTLATWSVRAMLPVELIISLRLLQFQVCKATWRWYISGYCFSRP